VQGRTRGINLIELVTALALVAMVAAMTLPFCLRAGEQIVRSRCLANMRQLGLAFRLYALDQRGHYPPSAAGTPIGPFPEGEGFAALAAYAGDPSVFYCPANHVFRVGLYRVDAPSLGRRMAGYACWARRPSKRGTPIADCVAGDAGDPSGAVLASDIIASDPGRRDQPHVYMSHRGEVVRGGHLLHNDGHVSWRHYWQTRLRLPDTGGADWYF
jgi:hypothetical protein